MPPTLTDLARGSCQGSSAPTVVAAAQQPTLPPQNLNIPFKTMEWNGPVAGRLSRFIENWKLITTDPWVLNTVQGHQIEFLQQPGFHRLPPMHYSHQEKLAISEEVTKMQGKGAVVPVHRDLQEECFLSNLFLVPKKDGGMRPVINLKGLNHFVKSEHFKMEGLHLLSTMVKPGDWFTKVDLKDAYFHVPIHQTHQKFLSFRWEGRVFQFVCLPFGLASAPRTFTKVMKPALACLRQLGVRCIVYLDDLLIMGQSPEEARQVTANTLALFQALGFLINWEKSILEPKQEIVFLGLLVSSRTMTLSLPSPKLIDLRREIQSLLTKEVVSVRQLAHIVGKLNSTALAVLPAPLHYRELQNLKISSLHEMESYNAQTALSPAARDDLSWWLGQLQRWNGRSFIVKRPEVVIQSDASLRGWGAVYQGQCIQGRWSFEESTWHINCLELKAATLAIQTFLNGQRNLQVHIQLDNTSAVAYINHKGGTHSPQLMKLTSNLWEWCLDRQIQVLATHLPGVCNIQADHLSRHLTDRCDWKLNPIVFQSILHIWGPLEMDWFASRLSTQLPLFCSWKPDPEAWATDAFGQDWTQFRGFANPPWCLVGRCLQQVEHQEAELVMVTPAWFSQPWWPQILSLCVELPHLIPSRPDIMVPTSPAMPPLFENPPQLVVWKLSGNLAKQTSFQSRLRDCSSPHGESLQARATTQHGGNGLAGVTKGKFLQFLVLPIR